MAYSKKIYDIATGKLNARRESALSMAEYRKSEVYTQIPRLREIDEELSSIGASTAKAVLSGQDAVTQLTSLKEKSSALQAEYNQLLTQNGYYKDYLEPMYACERCFDTGYVECNNRTTTCDCFLKLLSATACEELNKISPLSLSTFESFKLDYYNETPDINGNVPYVRMSKIFDYCLNYAKTFTSQSKGILMKGDTGLGKTHLSLSIANEVIRRGYSVVYVSAPDILSQLEREHFSYAYSNEQQLMQSLVECDLLILDDLGTEFTTQFTTTAIYNLFNTRINTGRPVIINTNLTASELEKTYSQRFVSRVMSSCAVLDFIGKDIRALL